METLLVTFKVISMKNTILTSPKAFLCIIMAAISLEQGKIQEFIRIKQQIWSIKEDGSTSSLMESENSRIIRELMREVTLKDKNMAKANFYGTMGQVTRDILKKVWFMVKELSKIQKGTILTLETFVNIWNMVKELKTKEIKHMKAHFSKELVADWENWQSMKTKIKLAKNTLTKAIFMMTILMGKELTLTH